MDLEGGFFWGLMWLQTGFVGFSKNLMGFDGISWDSVGFMVK